ncbi:hypothetical protein [Blastococcus sp. Marseille-P5729]|uniref:hypothetical protein n=1 Tax=Blastococcus sp. Marseille-P5729 TaxID=2086582 RepID=UPI000D0FECFA|nr:hypothetical protein [Blastococcus sp. Marseille-P5729]
MLAELLRGHGTACEVTSSADGATFTVDQQASVFVRPGSSEVVAQIWQRLFEGALACHGHRLTLQRHGLHWVVCA